MDLLEFDAKIDRSGGPSACWPWTGVKQSKGYGQPYVDGRRVYAHRLAWELENGPIPEGAKVDHLCHNGTDCPGGPTCPHRLCCNPTHLEPTTQADNLDRSHNAPQHRDRCPSGHEYTPENTAYQRPARPNRRPSRKCRACRVIHNRRRYVQEVQS